MKQSNSAPNRGLATKECRSKHAGREHCEPIRNALLRVEQGSSTLEEVSDSEDKANKAIARRLNLCTQNMLLLTSDQLAGGVSC
jgi:hypothetical protein